MRKLKYLFWLILTFLPQWVFAANGATGGGANNGVGDGLNNAAQQLGALAPGLYDKSVTYLGDLFGTVPGVLSGTSGQLLSTVFGVFNYGIVIAASFFIGYAIFRAVVDTANEGNFMGQGKNAAYISLRVAGGIGLLAPIFKGYSAVQIVVMFIVLHGAGFADKAWNKALDYLYNGGAVFVAPQTSAANLSDTEKIVQMASGVYINQVCMYRSEAWYNQQKEQVQQLAKKNPSNPVYQQQLSALNKGTNYWKPQFDDTNMAATFPGGSPDSLSEDACGSISWKVNAPSANGQSVTSYTKLALQQMLLTTQSAAQEVGKLPAPKSQLIDFSNTSSAESKENDSETALIGAAADFLNVTIPARNQSTGSNQELLQNFYESSRKEGWITAGGYYYTLGLLKTKLSSATDIELTVAGKPNQDDFQSSDYKQITNLSSTITNDYLQSALEKVQQQAQYDSDDTGTSSSWQQFFDAFGVSGSNPTGIYKSSGWGSGVGPNVIQSFFGPLFYEPVKGWLELVQGKTTDGQPLSEDPILRLQDFGYSLMTYLPNTIKTEASNAIAWIFIPWGFDAKGASGFWAPLFGILIGVFSPLLQPVIKILVLLGLVPFFLILAALFFVQGVMLAIYLPLVPFILFTVGVVGWLIAVIEAMVAAPLVALGVTHPEGHDLLGKSEQAVMLLLSVFIRPVTMIIGLLAGMVLSYVVMYVLDGGFGEIAAAVVANKSGFGDSWGIIAFTMPLTLMAIYTFLAVMLIQKAYSLIYIIPEKTMRWIGLTPEHDSDAMQIVQQGQSMVSSGAGRGFEGAKSATASVAKAGFEAAKQGGKAAMGAM